MQMKNAGGWNRLVPFKVENANGLVAKQWRKQSPGSSLVVSLKVQKFKSSWVVVHKASFFMEFWFHINSFDINDSILVIFAHIRQRPETIVP